MSPTTTVASAGGGGGGKRGQPCRRQLGTVGSVLGPGDVLRRGEDVGGVGGESAILPRPQRVAVVVDGGRGDARAAHGLGGGGLLLLPLGRLLLLQWIDQHVGGGDPVLTKRRAGAALEADLAGAGAAAATALLLLLVLPAPVVGG